MNFSYNEKFTCKPSTPFNFSICIISELDCIKTVIKTVILMLLLNYIQITIYINIRVLIEWMKFLVYNVI